MITVHIWPPSSEIQYTSMVFFLCLLWNTVLIWSIGMFFVLSASERAELDERRTEEQGKVEEQREDESIGLFTWISVWNLIVRLYGLVHLKSLIDCQTHNTQLLQLFSYCTAHTHRHRQTQHIPSVSNSSPMSSPSIMRRTHTPWLESKESLRASKNSHKNMSWSHFKTKFRSQ